MPPIVTLTTDFGLSDHYVGTMKGVVLGICPKAQLVDISHQVAPYAIAEGAYTVAQAYPYFPKGAVHVVVVDPGVGSARRPILVEAAGHYFIGPDNGVFGMIFASARHKVRVLANRRYFLPAVSGTFHGRDVFAPAAAHLAAGVPPAKFGPRVEDYVRAGFESPSQTSSGKWEGQLLAVDRFGNLITNFRVAEFPGFGRMTIAKSKLSRVVKSYAEARDGELFAIAGSGGYWEVSMKQESAARRLGCTGGAVCRLEVATPPRA